MLTRRISAIVGTLLALLTLVGTPTAAKANEVTTQASATTPQIYCALFFQCN